MPKDNYKSEISALNSEIENRGDVWELYYKRGYFFYLCGRSTELLTLLGVPKG